MMDNPLEELQWQERLPRTWMSSHYDEELLRTSPMQHILSPIANNVRHTQHKEDGDVEEAEERHRPRRHDDAPRRDRNIHTRVHFDPSPHMTKNSSSVERHSADALPPRWYDGVGLTPPSVSKSTHRSSRSSISSQDVRGGRGVERELLLREREVRFYQTESVEMSSRLAQAEQEKEALRQRLGGAAEVMSARMKMQEMVRAECLHVEEAERWKHCAEEAEERGKLMAVMMIEVVAIASSSSTSSELRHDDDGRVSGALLGTSPRVFNAASTRCDVDEFSRPRHPTPSRGDERLVEQVRVLSSRLDAREEELKKMKHRNQRERHSLERDLESERTLTHEMQEEMDDLIISELVLHETVARERMRREAAEGQADVWGQWIRATQHHHQQQQHGVVQVFDAHTSSSSSFPRAEELQDVLRTSVVDAILSHVLPLLSPRVEEAMSTMREAASMMQSSSSTVLHHHAEYMQSTSREAARVDARLAHVEELLQQAGGTPEMMNEIVSVAEEVRRAQTCVAALTDAVKRSSRLSSHNDVALNAKMSDLLSCQSAQCRTMLLSAAESMAMEEPHTTSPPRADDEELSPLMPATMPPRSSSDVHVGASGGAPSSPATPSTSKRAAPLITKSASSLSMLMERSSNSVLTQVEDEHLFCPRLEMPSQDFDLSLSEDESIPSARDVRASFSSFRTPYDA